MKTLEQVRTVNTPEEMRMEIARLERHYPILHDVFVLASREHLSAEDFYTVLAYTVIRSQIELLTRSIEFKLLKTITVQEGNE